MNEPIVLHMGTFEWSSIDGKNFRNWTNAWPKINLSSEWFTLK